MPTEFWSPVKLSIEVASVSGILASILGLVFGKIMANTKFRGKAIVETGFLLPLVLPPTVVGNIPGKTQTIPTAIYMAIDSGNIAWAWLWVLSIIAISFMMLICVRQLKS